MKIYVTMKKDAALGFKKGARGWIRSKPVNGIAYVHPEDGGQARWVLEEDFDTDLTPEQKSLSESVASKVRSVPTMSIPKSAGKSLRAQWCGRALRHPEPVIVYSSATLAKSNEALLKETLAHAETQLGRIYGEIFKKGGLCNVDMLEFHKVLSLIQRINKQVRNDEN